MLLLLYSAPPLNQWYLPDYRAEFAQERERERRIEEEDALALLWWWLNE